MSYVLPSAPNEYSQRDQASFRQTLTQALADLNQARAAIKVLQATPAGSTPKATDTVSGTVKVNTPDGGGDPVVYRKPEVDALIAGVSGGINQLTGDVTAGPGTGSQAATIGAGKVTLAKQADVATATVFYRKTAGTGSPEVQTLATLKTDLNVPGLPITLTLSVSTMTLDVGRVKTLTVTAVDAASHGVAIAPTWASSDTTIATVDANGKVLGLRVGSCTISASADGVTSGNCTVTVLEEAVFFLTPADIEQNFAAIPAVARGTFTTPSRSSKYDISRVGPAWDIDDNGYIRRRGTNQPMISTIAGVKYAVIDTLGTTNNCIYSDDISKWTQNNAPVLTSGQADIYGLSNAYNISDTSASVVESVSLTLPALLNNLKTKGVIMAIKKGAVSSAAGSTLVLRDTTASADKYNITITWSAGLPVVSASAGTYMGYITLANGWFLLMGKTATITIADTHTFTFSPAGTAAQQGDVYVGGFQVESAFFPTMIVPTVGFARARAAQTGSTTVAIGQIDEVPQPYSGYMKFRDGGEAIALAGAGYFAPGGPGGSGSSGVQMVNNGTALQATLNNNASNSTASSSYVPVWGDTYEWRYSTSVSATPACTLGYTHNGGAETTNTGSASTQPYQSAFTNAFIIFGGNGGNFMYVERILVIRGVHTLADCQAYFA